MKYLILTFIAIVLGCSAPSSLPAHSGQKENTEVPHGKIVDFDFSKIKVRSTPPPFPYPSEAKKAGIEGVVVVDLLVGPDGVPVKAHAISGPDMLKIATEQYCMGCRFEPYLIKGIPQYFNIKLTYPWHLTKK